MLLHIKVSEATAARRRIPFRAVLDADGTPIVGLSFIVPYDVTLVKNGAAPVSGDGSVAEVGGGEYYYEATAAELNTLGFLLVRIENSAGGMRRFVGNVQIVPLDPFGAKAVERGPWE